MKNTKTLNINNITSEEIFKISKNFILLFTGDYVNVLKMTRYKEIAYIATRFHFIEASIRIIDNIGKKRTLKVQIHPKLDSEELRFVLSTDNYINTYTFKNIEDVIDLNLENIPFEKDFETAKKELEEKKEYKKHKSFVEQLSRSISYNMKQKRSYKGAKRSYVKYDINYLKSIVENNELDEKQSNYLQGVIDEIEGKNDSKINKIKKQKPKSSKEFISFFSGGSKMLLEKLEKTFENSERNIYEMAIKWMNNNTEFEKYSKEKINILAKDYVENQKMKLFYSALKNISDLKIKDVENLTFSNHPNGFEGSWKLTLDDNSQKIFETSTIIASGMIQKPHYRYLTKIY